MNKKAIFAMIVAVLVTACMVMSTAGIVAADVRPSAEPSAEELEVAAALAARLGNEVGAEVNEAVVAEIVQMAALKQASRRASRQGAVQDDGAVLDVAAVEAMNIIDHGAPAIAAWDDRVVCPGDWEAHYFPPWMVPGTYASAAITWDNAYNDLDLYMITFDGGDWAWWSGSPLVETVGPVSTTNWFLGNGGVFLLVNHWGGPSCQYYVVAVDTHWFWY